MIILVQRTSSIGLSANSFRFYFTGRPAHLFTFPSRYLFTIGHTLYLALEGGPPRFPQSICSMVLGNQTRWIWISRTGLSPSLVSHSRLFCYPPPSRMLVPQHPTRGFRLFRFRSPLLTESLRFLFLRVLRCFSSPSSPQVPDGTWSPCLHRMGFPHSEIAGLSVVGTYPTTIAANCVLLR